MGDKLWWPSAVFSYRSGLSCRAVTQTFGEDPSAWLRSQGIQETELSRHCSPRLSFEPQSKRAHPLGSSGSCDVVCQLIDDKLPVFNDALDQISD
jgi:hypothetical protein